jgi:hypothetical protein
VRTRLRVHERELEERERRLREDAGVLRLAAVLCSRRGERTLAYELLIVSGELERAANGILISH